MAKKYNNIIPLQQGFSFTEPIPADDRYMVETRNDITTLVVPIGFKVLIEDELNTDNTFKEIQYTGGDISDLANWIEIGLEDKTQIKTNTNNIAALSSGQQYPIPQTGNTPANEPAPTVNGTYPVTEAGTYTNFGNTNIPTLDNVKVEIIVSGNQDVFKVNTTPLNITTDSLDSVTDDIPTPNSDNLVRSGGVADSLANIQIKERFSFKELTSITTNVSSWINNGILTIPKDTDYNGKLFGYNLNQTNKQTYIKVVSEFNHDCRLMNSNGGVIETVSWTLREDGKYEYINYNDNTGVAAFFIYFTDTTLHVSDTTFYYEEVSTYEEILLEDKIAEIDVEVNQIPENTSVIKEEISEDVSKSVGLSNGSTSITDGFQIPIGQTGANSYFILTPQNFEFDSTIRLGSKQIYTLELNITNYLELTQPLEFDFFAQRFQNGSQLTNEALTPNYVDVVNGDDLTRTYTIEVENTQIDIDNEYYYRVYMPIQNSESVTQNVDVSILSLAYAKLKYLNDRVKILENKVTEIGNIKYTTITAVRNGVGDFTGRNAIQNAIDSISDASYTNQYIIKPTGIFEATQQSDYNYNIGLDFYQLIEGKDFVNIDAGDRSKCAIICSLPDGLGTGFDYERYQSVYWNANAYIKNITILGKNLRYPLHIDGSTLGLCNNFVQDFDNLTVWHQGNEGDALAVWGIGTAFGYGSNSGQKVTFKNSTLRNPKSGIYEHDNFDFENSSETRYINCEVINDEANAGGNIVIENLGSGVSSKMILENTEVAQGVVKMSFGSNSTTNLKADNANIELITDLVPRGIRNINSDDICLRIDSLATGSGSSVKFSGSGDAFNALIGKSNETTEIINRYNFKQIQGYSYRQGINGLSGYAFGYWNIKETKVQDTYINSLGKRLGDCSTVNKTLGIIVNGVTFTVTFDKNYDGTAANLPPNYTNAQIIAEINAVIGAVALASEYNVSANYYPKFKGVESRINGDTQEVLNGMGIVFLANNKFRRASNSDGYIDGIVLDDSGVGELSRLITKGEIYSQNTNFRFNVYEAPAGQIAFGQKTGINPSVDGQFLINATPTVLECKQTDVYTIV